MRSAPLLPREHGASVQLLAPLVGAMFVRQLSAPAILLVSAAAAAYLGSEALLVLRGARGTRRLERDRGRASHRVRICGAIAIATSTTGLLLAPEEALAVAGLVAVPVALSLVLAAKRRIQTRAGELLAATALAGAGAPVAAASGVPLADALGLWVAWSIGFATTVFAVHAVLARHRNPATHARLGAFVGVVASVGALAAVYPIMAVALPLAIVSAVVAAVLPSAKRLVIVGICMAIASACSVAIAALVV